MPVGSGLFPRELPQCPGNGLVIYTSFSGLDLKRVTMIVTGAEYTALRKTETPYYLAYFLDRSLGSESAVYYLLRATWEAKIRGDDDARVLRYNREFVALVRAMPVDPANFESIVLRGRAANALREMGAFDEAETIRAAIVISPAAGDGYPNAAEHRKSWAAYLAQLATAIARADASRAPIDMIGRREATFRCLGPDGEAATVSPPPLTPFEQSYCADSGMVKAVAEVRAARARWKAR
ncbi:hypothetical protein M0208_14875 [Sphingomonas sp. SUN019]|uniref:hypothetical protein n=1 Tax=Sphingomonas sp. SUN019 TaxID=2937788 RepID=UPI0021641972|nr:hypothetical protein [Sphingomonas sp. SUN019]UVO51728.1 hypothetical protein M0208_14875 [Sphingomonas sp. SUN019]